MGALGRQGWEVSPVRPNPSIEGTSQRPLRALCDVPSCQTLAVMTEDERWAHLVALDDELLKGGVIHSEWCTFIVRDADTAFAGGVLIITPD